MTDPLKAGRMRLVAFGVLLATFGVGALAGAAVDRVALADDSQQDNRRGDRNDGPGRHHIIDELDLEPAQRASIDSILERRGERMRAVWADMAPRLEAIADSTRLEIMDVLTADQRAEFEAKLEERRQRKEREEAERQEGGQPDGRSPGTGDSASAKRPPPL